ncbi:MAG: AsmA-like C-terminal region-containing protein, partial [Flavobacterium sp.]
GCQVGMNATYENVTTKKAWFEYQIKATDFDIQRAYKEIKLFREMASAAGKAQGIVSLDYKLKGRLNEKMEPVLPSLKGNGVVSVKNIKLYGLKMFTVVGSQTNHDKIKNPELSKVAIKSSIKNNIITIERFKFKFAGFRPRIEGTTSLDGKLNIKMRLGLPPLGIFGLPITVTGNKDNPKIKIGQESKDLKETEDTGTD